MYNANKPSNEDLPSTSQLIKSTVLALLGAGVLLVTVVWPSEYGMDPTGVGKMLGLTDMGEIKQSLVLEAEADAIAHAPQVENVIEETQEDFYEATEEVAPEIQPEPAPQQNNGHHHGDGDYHRH